MWFCFLNIEPGYKGSLIEILRLVVTTANSRGKGKLWKTFQEMMAILDS